MPEVSRLNLQAALLRTLLCGVDAQRPPRLPLQQRPSGLSAGELAKGALFLLTWTSLALSSDTVWLPSQFGTGAGG